MKAVFEKIAKQIDIRRYNRHEELTVFIAIHQRIIQGVGIAIVVLRIFDILNIRVGRYELGYGRVIKTSIHIDKPKPRQMLMSGIAAAQQGEFRLVFMVIHLSGLGIAVAFWREHVC